MQKDFGYTSVIHALSIWDQKLFLFINSLHAEWLNPIMQIISGQGIWLPIIFFFIWMAKKQFNQKTFGLFVLLLFLSIFASDVSSSYIIKNLVQRLRPCHLEELKELINQFGQKCGGKFGFVSSHAANSFCILVFSFITLNLKINRYQWLWILPFLVSLSRIYLGVHYPGDILGGFIIGGFWGYIMAYHFNNSVLRRQSI